MKTLSKLSIIKSLFGIILLTTILTSCKPPSKKGNEQIETGSYGMSMYIISGDYQETSASLLYPIPLRIQILSENGEPVKGLDINFTAVNDDATHTIEGVSILIPTMKTDRDGFAYTQVKAGPFNEHIFKIIATAPKINRTVEFHLSTDFQDGGLGIFRFKLTTSGYVPGSTTANHNYYKHSVDPLDLKLKPDNQITPNPESHLFGRNFEDAKVPFTFKIEILNVSDQLCDDIGTATVPYNMEITWFYDTHPSWTGQTAILPSLTMTCPFIEGICDVAGAWTVPTDGVTRIWAGNGPGLPHDATGIEILVQSGSIVAGIVATDKTGGPEFEFSTDLENPNATKRNNIGAIIYGAFEVSADTDKISFNVAKVDDAGNYIGDYTAPGDTTWTWADSVFAGRMYSDPPLTVPAVTGSTEPMLHFTPEEIGSGTLNFAAGAFSDSTNFTVTHGSPHHLLATARSSSKAPQVPTLTYENKVWAGELSPIDIIIADEYNNICSTITGMVPIRINVARFNLATEKVGYDSDVILFPDGFFPNSSGGKIRIKQGIGTVAYDSGASDWIEDSAGNPLMNMYFINGKVTGDDDTGLNVMFRDSNFSPYIHVETEKMDFNSGITAVQKLTTENYTGYTYAGEALWVDDTAQTALHSILVMRNDPAHITIRSTAGKMAMCKNNVYNINKTNPFNQIFTKDDCAGINQNSLSPIYDCGGNNFTYKPCLSLSVGSASTDYVPYLEDDNGNVLDFNQGTPATVDPISVTWVGEDTFSKAGVLTETSGILATFNPIELHWGTIKVSGTTLAGFTRDDGYVYGTYPATAISSSSMSKIVSTSPYDLKLMVENNKASDDNQNLVVLCFDKYDNWVDASGARDLRIFLVNKAGTDPRPKRSPDNTIPVAAGIELDNGGTYFRNAVTEPFPANIVQPVDAHPGTHFVTTNVSTSEYTADLGEGEMTRQVYRISVKLPKPKDEVSFVVSTDVLLDEPGPDTTYDRIAFSQIETVTIADGDLFQINIQKYNAPNDADQANPEVPAQGDAVNFSTCSGQGDGVGAQMSTNPYSQEAAKQFTFTADQEFVTFCIMPYDKHHNYCETCLLSGAGGLLKMHEIKEDPAGSGVITFAVDDTGFPAITNNKTYAYDSSILHRSSDITPNGTNCIVVNFDKTENVALTVPQVPDGSSTVEIVDQRVGATTRGTLKAFWEHDSITIHETVEISIRHGDYKDLKFDTTITDSLAGDYIPIDGLVAMYDGDHNLVTTGEGDNQQSLYFELQNNSSVDLTAPNELPPSTDYQFTDGLIVTAETGFRIIELGSAFKMKVGDAVSNDTKFINVTHNVPEKLTTGCPDYTLSQVAGTTFDCYVKLYDVWNNLVTAGADSSANDIRIDFTAGSVPALEANFIFTSVLGGFIKNWYTPSVSARYTGALTAGEGHFQVNTKFSPEPGAPNIGNIIMEISSPSLIGTVTSFISPDPLIVPDVVNTLDWHSGGEPLNIIEIGSEWGAIVDGFDQFGNLTWNITGEPDTMSITAASSTSALTSELGAPAFTSAMDAGISNFSQIKYMEEEEIIIEVEYKTTGIKKNKNITFQDSSGPVYAVVILPGQTFHESAASLDAVVTGNPVVQMAGVPFTDSGIDVRILNAGFKVITTPELEAISFRLLSSDSGTTETPQELYALGGIKDDINFTGKRATMGTPHTMRVDAAFCSTTISCVVSSEYSVIPRDINHQVFIALPNQTNIVRGKEDINEALPDEPTSFDIDTPFDVNIYVSDQYHNVITAGVHEGAQIKLSFPNDDEVTPPLPVTISGGYATVQIRNFKSSVVKDAKEQSINVLCDSACGVGGLNQTTSTLYKINHGTPDKIITIFSNQIYNPGRALIGDAVVNGINPLTACTSATVETRIVDNYHNTVFSQMGQSVSLSTTDTTDEGTYTYVFPDTLAAVTTFDLLSYRVTGTGYTLTSSTDIGGISNSNVNYNVSVGTAAKVISVLPSQLYTSGAKNLYGAGGAVTGGVTNRTAGSAFDVDIYITDSCYNHVTTSGAATVDIKMDTDHSFNNLTAEAVPAGGHIQLPNVKNTTADTGHVLSAEITGLTSASSTSYIVDAAAATQTIIRLEDQAHIPGVTILGDAITGPPKTQKAGVEFNVEVMMVDNWFNITNDTSAFTIVATDLNATLPGSQNFVAGKKTVTIKNVKSTDIVPYSCNLEAVTAKTDKTSNDYLVNAGNISQTIVLLPGQNHIEGVLNLGDAIDLNFAGKFAGESFNVTIKAVDQYFNTVDYDGTFEFASNSEFSHLPPAGYFEDGVQGPLAIIHDKRNPTTNIELVTALVDNTSDDYNIGSAAPAKLMARLPSQTLKEGAPDIATALPNLPADAIVNSGFDVEIIAVDQFHNVVDDDITWIGLDVSSADLNATSSNKASDGSYVLTDGKYTFSGIKNFTANSNPDYPGVRFINPTYQDKGNAYTLIQSSSYKVDPGAESEIIVVLPGQTLKQGKSSYATAVTEAPDGQVAGEVVPNIEIYAVDSHFNVRQDNATKITGFSVAFDSNITASPIPVSLVKGKGLVSIKNVKAQTLAGLNTVDDSTYSNTISKNYTVTHGIISHFLVLVGQGHIEGVLDLATAVTDPVIGQEAGTPFTVEIKAVDQCYNIVKDFNLATDVSFSFTGTGANPALDTPFENPVKSAFGNQTFNSGELTLTNQFTLYRKGDHPTIRVTAVESSGYSGEVTVSENVMSYVKISDAANGAGNEVENPTFSTSGTDPKFYAATYDEYGNFIQDDPLAVWSFSSGGTTLTSPGAFTTFTLSNALLATDIVIKTTVAAGSKQDETGAIHVYDDGADHFDIALIPPNPGVGVPFNIEVTAKTNDNNTATLYVGDRTVTFSTNAGPGTDYCGAATPALEFPGAHTLTFTLGVATYTNANTKFKKDENERTITAQTISLSGTSAATDITIGALNCTRMKSEAGGAGVFLTDKPGMEIGDEFNAHAAGFDAYGNFINDQSVTWEQTGGYLTVSPGSGSSTTVYADQTSGSGGTFGINGIPTEHIDVDVSSGTVIHQWLALLPGETHMNSGVGTRAEAIGASTPSAIKAGDPINLTLIAVDARFYKIAGYAQNTSINFEMTGANSSPAPESKAPDLIGFHFFMAGDFAGSEAAYNNAGKLYLTGDSPTVDVTPCPVICDGQTITIPASSFNIVDGDIDEIRIIVQGDPITTLPIPDGTIYDSGTPSPIFEAHTYDAYDNYKSAINVDTWSTSHVDLTNTTNSLTTELKFTTFKFGDTVITATEGAKSGSTGVLKITDLGVYKYDINYGGPATAGTQFTATITAKDVSDNPVPGYTGLSRTLAWDETGETGVNSCTYIGSVTPSFATTANFITGSADVDIILVKGGNDRTITLTSPAQATSNSFAINPHATQCIKMMDAPGETGAILSGTIKNIDLNETFVVHAAGYDRYGNYFSPSASSFSWTGTGVSEETAVPHKYNLKTVVTGVKYGAGGTIDVAGFLSDGHITVNVSNTPTDLSMKSDNSCTNSEESYDHNCLAGNNSNPSFFWDLSVANEVWRTTSESGSWYSETSALNERGDRDHFPARTYIVAGTSGIDIIDSGSNVLFMRFLDCSGCTIDRTDWGEINSISAINGKMFVGMDGGLVLIDFENDKTYKLTGTTRTMAAAGIVSRNTSQSWNANTDWPLITTSINGLASRKVGATNYLAIGANDRVISLDVSTKALSATDATISNASAVYITTAGDLYYANGTETLSRGLVSDLSSPTNYNNQIRGRIISQIEIAEGISSGAKNIVYTGSDKGMATIDEDATQTPANAAIKSYSKIGTNSDNAGGGASIRSIEGVLNFGNDGVNSSALMTIPVIPASVDRNESTIDLRFMPHSTIDSNLTADAYLLSKGSMADVLANIGNYRLFFDSSDGKLTFTIKWDTSSSVTITSFATSWTANKWYHIRISIDGDGRHITMFVNGERNSDIRPDDPFMSADDHTIVVGEDFHGALDELAITSKVYSESKHDVSSFSISSSAWSDSDSDIMYLYHFDDNSGMAVSETGNGGGSTDATLSATDTPWFSTPLFETTKNNVLALMVNENAGKAEGRVVKTDNAGTGSSVFTISNLELSGNVPYIYMIEDFTEEIRDLFIYQIDSYHNYDVGYATDNGLLLTRLDDTFVQYGDDIDHPGKSCLDILQVRPGATNGAYYIKGSGAAFAVSCDMTGGGWTRIVYEAENSPAAGWSCTDTATFSWTGSGGNILIHGHWGSDLSTNSKTHDLKGIQHSEARITVRYFSLDTWNNNEHGWMYVNSIEVWEGTRNGTVVSAIPATPWTEIANLNPNNQSSSIDGYWEVDETVTHENESNIQIMMSNKLNNVKTDESWGFDKFTIWVK